MLTRRHFLQAASAASCLPLLENKSALAAVLPQAATSANDEDLTQHVNIRVGTGGHGHTYPGATVPFGAMQLSPDTYTKGWDWCSGYYRENYSPLDHDVTAQQNEAELSLMGFSHTHLSGTGCGDARHTRRPDNRLPRAVFARGRTDDAGLLLRAAERPQCAG
jgi:putative alpha-1,2-mannosidase